MCCDTYPVTPAVRRVHGKDSSDDHALWICWNRACVRSFHRPIMHGLRLVRSRRPWSSRLSSLVETHFTSELSPAHHTRSIARRLPSPPLSSRSGGSLGRTPIISVPCRGGQGHMDPSASSARAVGNTTRAGLVFFFFRPAQSVAWHCSRMYTLSAWPQRWCLHNGPPTPRKGAEVSLCGVF